VTQNQGHLFVPRIRSNSGSGRFHQSERVSASFRDRMRDNSARAGNDRVAGRGWHAVENEDLDTRHDADAELLRVTELNYAPVGPTPAELAATGRESWRAI
jgi:hypothetical protein